MYKPQLKKAWVCVCVGGGGGGGGGGGPPQSPRSSSIALSL